MQLPLVTCNLSTFVPKKRHIHLFHSVDVEHMWPVLFVFLAVPRALYLIPH